MGIIFSAIDVLLPLIALVTYGANLKVAFYVLSVIFFIARWVPGLFQGATGCMEILTAIISTVGLFITGGVWYDSILLGICGTGLAYNVYYLYKYWKLTNM